jgi:hypothetical protein
MADSWDEMKRAKEDMYFEEQNRKALGRLKGREESKPRLSPITGKPMEQVTFMGVVIDRCTDSGGVWLDAGELQQILEHAGTKENVGGGYLKSFFEFMTTKTK